MATEVAQRALEKTNEVKGEDDDEPAQTRKCLFWGAPQETAATGPSFSH